MKRVVVTGMSAITALGDDWSTFRAALEKGENAVESDAGVAEVRWTEYLLRCTG